ncbi:P-loop containing nucleoside triphosphate hydrolase [Phytophthora cactorum]|nr:P-loop containing nucleoside triphosphate hydrolase [Phytophthora cactorum]
MSKCTRVEYNGHVLNIVDTPGHADFGGEVERILSMVDGVVLVVDATEVGVPRVVRLCKQGWAVRDLDNSDESRDSMLPLLDEITRYVPAPEANADKPFAMAVTMIGHDRTWAVWPLIGDSIQVMNRESKKLESGRVTKMFVTRGVAKSEITSATAGDIITIAGVNAYVSDTIADVSVTEPIPSPQLDPPTISMTFGVNDAPTAGKDGKFLTSSHIKQRLERECENNVAISISPSASSEAFDVHGRGELQLAILIEEMRREGFEMSVSAPQVIFQTDPETSQKLEPIEEVTIDVDSDFSGTVIDKLSTRGGEIIEFKEIHDKVRLQFKIPSRCLMGYRSEIKTDTRGSGILNSIFHGYSPFQGSATPPSKGKLISSSGGVCTAYALNSLEDRGEMFVKPGDDVYEGMIVGEHSRPTDIEINPTKEKKLTNMRAAGTDENIKLSPFARCRSKTWSPTLAKTR